jgi:hypothetical protein
MEKAKSDRIHDLCSRIAVEQDQQNFLILVEELNRVLSADRQSLRNAVPEHNQT